MQVPHKDSPFYDNTATQSRYSFSGSGSVIFIPHDEDGTGGGEEKRGIRVLEGLERQG